MLHVSQQQACLVYSEALKHAIDFRCATIPRLSARIGISRSSLYNYCTGRYYPSKRVHLLLCEVLGFDLPYYGQGVRRVGRFKNIPK